MEGSVCWSPAALDRCWNWEVAPSLPYLTNSQAESQAWEAVAGPLTGRLEYPGIAHWRALTLSRLRIYRGNRQNQSGGRDC